MLNIEDKDYTNLSTNPRAIILLYKIADQFVKQIQDTREFIQAKIAEV